MDYGERARTQSRILNELIAAKKKIEKLMETDYEFKQKLANADYSQIDKQTMQTRAFAGHLREVLREDRVSQLRTDDVINMFKLVACGQLTIQEKKEVVELMGLKEHNRLRLLRQLDRFEDEEKFTIGIRNANFYAYSDDELQHIAAFLSTALTANSIDAVKEGLRTLEDAYLIEDVGTLSLVLWAFNPNEFFIMDETAKQAMWRTFGIALPTNPYNYADLDDIFYIIKYKNNLSHYGQVDYLIRC